jgi:hypothetical protein
MRNRLLPLAFLLAALAPGAARATTIDFSSGVWDLAADTYTQQGFLVAIENAPLDVDPASPSLQWWTWLNCSVPVCNPSSPNPTLLTFGGGLFTLEQVTLVTNPIGITFASSSGGSVTFAGNDLGVKTLPASFADVSFVRVTIGGFSSHAIDDLVLTPEPARGLMLAAFGAAALASLRRRTHG